MFGTTLVEIRNHIEELATDDGSYVIVCGRTGEQPVPTTGLTFEDRTTAENAVRAATQYRSALRRYDPRVPYYDLIVSQSDDARMASARPSGAWGTGAEQKRGAPVFETEDDGGQQTERIEFCHRVASSVFEALSDTGHRAVETAVMDAYFELAETTSSPDELCLRLLESMATELHYRLESSEQAAVLARASERLPSRPGADGSVEATLDEMQRLGLIGSYTCSQWSPNPEDGTKSVEITFGEYALSEREGRLPVLPVILDLYRRRGASKPVSLHVTREGDEWHGKLAVSSESKGVGLASVPIHSKMTG
ncbi:DUF7551 domain-containing protein [Haloferax larsenii]|uniref:Uncharacterized protein n=1 Tax=Haloferax larsenii TaxID=302484 RepID=A0A1H7NRB8_HALLR|nr:hypothetical protein [Haloferax larsenii]SEL25578.1 hypothetical protein SAMN04488691_103397 [Haloferax larsenii]